MIGQNGAGYPAMRTGRLRALAGGPRRFGGLLDLVSISATEAREDMVPVYRGSLALTR